MRTVTGVDNGFYYTIFEEELEDKAEELGISVSAYCMLWDFILSVHKSDPNVDIPAKIQHLMSILKGNTNVLE